MLRKLDLHVAACRYRLDACAFAEYYVEMIFSGQAFVDALPDSIEAVFYMHVDPERLKCDQSRPECPRVGMSWPNIDQGKDCIDATSGPKCRDYATRAWRTMLRHFKLGPKRLPLLRFDPFDWETPFVDVSSSSCPRC